MEESAWLLKEKIWASAYAGAQTCWRIEMKRRKDP
jgi:hypothetical protein